MWTYAKSWCVDPFWACQITTRLLFCVPKRPTVDMGLRLCRNTKEIFFQSRTEARSWHLQSGSIPPSRRSVWPLCGEYQHFICIWPISHSFYRLSINPYFSKGCQVSKRSNYAMGIGTAGVRLYHEGHSWQRQCCSGLIKPLSG